ncbi:MAG: hypothetical protein SF051_10300 [Elusimicrobiota bacterium]|nr:hypothetical protein [Elusimicrobiota bacterium]
MTHLDLVLFAAILGAGAVARREALASPPAELLEQLDLFEDLSLVEDEDPEGDR